MLTERQRNILRFIAGTLRRRHRTPTVREIGFRFDIASPNGVIGHLKALARKGFIRRAGRRSRGIELVGAELRLACADSDAGRALREALGMRRRKRDTAGGPVI